MKGVVFLGDRKLELREFPDPTPGPRDVILAIKASGMCGSDLHTSQEALRALLGDEVFELVHGVGL
jgi:D-arabinose 1-dehydrogenase-like Zn-dependent alcohol dehydrogenase